MALTVLTAWGVGSRLTSIALNRMVTAIQELQSEYTTRPQLRVYAPASVTAAAKVPYATVRKDTESGWNATNKDYTVAKAGLYLVSVGWKASGTPATPSQYVDKAGTIMLSAPASASTAYAGGSLSGVLELAVNDVISVKEQGATFTPQNDTTASPGTGSNFLHITYLGPTST